MKPTRLPILLPCLLLVFCAQVSATITPISVQITATSTDSDGNVMPVWLSNVLTINRVTAPKLTIAITVDKTTAKPGDIVTYSAIATNTGDDAAKAVTVTLNIPSQLQFVTGSLLVNGVAAVLGAGNAVAMSDLAVGAKATISYRAKVL